MVFLGKDGGGRGTDAEAKTGCGVGMPSRSSLRFYLEKLRVIGLYLLYMFKYCFLGKKKKKTSLLK